MATRDFTGRLTSFQMRPTIVETLVPTLIWARVDFPPGFPASGNHIMTVNFQTSNVAPLDYIRGFFLDNSSNHRIAIQTKDVATTFRCGLSSSIQGTIMTTVKSLDLVLIGAGVPFTAGEFADLVVSNVPVPPCVFAREFT